MHVINVGGMLPYRAHVEFFLVWKRLKASARCNTALPGTANGVLSYSGYKDGACRHET